MFGYIKPLEGELLVKELELYKAVYCGLCRALKKHVSRIMPMTLSYDCTLLAMFRMALMRMPPRVSRKRCIASPFKKKCGVCSEEGDQLCYTAQVSTLLVHYKLKDDVSDRDKGFFKRFTRRLMLWGTITPLKKICRKNGIINDLSRSIENSLSRLSQLEKEGSCDVDTLAATSGELLSLAASAGLEGEKAEIASLYGMSVGKWLYVVDAFDDVEKDFKTGSFNPLLQRFGSVEEVKRNAEAVEAILSMYIRDAAIQLERLKPTCYNNILTNITTLGLEEAGRKVLYKKGENK